MLGVVKSWNAAKGFGTITIEGVEEEVFVHYSRVNMEGFVMLEPGETVILEVRQGPKGLHAENVTRVEDE